MKSTYNFLKQRNIVVLISCRIIWGLTQTLFMPYFSLFALAQEGVTPELLGLVISIRAVGTALLSPIAGYLADSLGRKKMIFAGTTLHAISYLVYVVAKDIRLIFLGALMEGLSIIHLPALQAITQDSLMQNQRGLGLSATRGLQAIPSLVSPLIGGILAKEYGIDTGMRIGFFLAFWAGLAVAFIRFKFLQETVDGTGEKVEPKVFIALVKKSYKSIFNLLRDFKGLHGLIILSMIDTFFGAIAAPFWVVYAEEVVGLSIVEWGLIQNIVAGLNIIILVFSGRYVDRFGRKKVIMLNLLLAPIINLSFIYCRNFPQMLLFLVSLTVQNAFIMPATTALVADIIPRKSRGRAIAAIGWQPVVIALGTRSTGFFRFPPAFVGSILSGYVFRLDVRFPWFLLAGAYILEFIISCVLIREPEHPAE